MPMRPSGNHFSVVDRLPSSIGRDPPPAFALGSTWHTVLVSFKYSMGLCLEVRVRPGHYIGTSARTSLWPDCTLSGGESARTSAAG